MIGLLLTLIIGFGIAYFSRHITSGLTITIGENVYTNVPLYVITVSTYLLGLLLARVIEIPQSILTSLRIMGLGRTIKSGNTTIEQLQSKITKLETENKKLQERNKSVIVNGRIDEEPRTNTIQNFLHRINPR